MTDLERREAWRLYTALLVHMNQCGATILDLEVVLDVVDDDSKAYLAMQERTPAEDL